MHGVSFRRRGYLLTAGILLLGVGTVTSQGTLRTTPRLEPVAETRLLMLGINLPNFQGLQRLLRQRPNDLEAWTYARGQALLIAENGNLLLLRPPKNEGRESWMERAADLRVVATRLARAIASQDYERSRSGLTDVANACNRCHQSFRVTVRLAAFEDSAVPQLPSPPAVPKPPAGPQPPRPPAVPPVPGSSGS